MYIQDFWALASSGKKALALAKRENKIKLENPSPSLSLRAPSGGWHVRCGPFRTFFLSFSNSTIYLPR